MTNLFLTCALLFGFAFLATAQNASINTDGSDPDPSAMLDVKSTDKGLLIPRMTTSQREGISAPAHGLLVFDQTTTSFWFYNGAAWEEIIKTSNDKDTDNQVLSISNDTLRLSRGGWVYLGEYYNTLHDADDDTKILVEKTADEDIIRMNVAGNEMVTLNSVGMGIGTPSPTQKLTVYDGDIALQTSNDTQHQSILFQNSGNSYPWRMRAQDNGWNASRSNFVISGGLNGNPNNLTDYFTISNGGMVGINNSDPAYRLDVNGEGYFRDGVTVGSYSLPTNEGTAGQVLMTDGAGTASWQTPPTHLLNDSDNDTRIVVEQNPDDDSIRFVLKGEEKMLLTKENGIAALSFPNNNNSILLGERTNAGSQVSSTLLGNSILTNSSAYGTGSIVIGDHAMETPNLAYDVVVIGADAGADLDANSRIDYSVIIGAGALGGTHTDSDLPDQKRNMGGMRFNVIMGYEAVGLGTQVDNSVILGHRSGYKSTGSYNVLIGNEAGYNTTGGNNVFIGDNAGSANTSGNDNTFLGEGSGLGNTTGLLNTFVGSDAGRYNTTGKYNTFIGRTSGGGGNYNTALGYYAGYHGTLPPDVFFKTSIGYRAGYLAESDSSVFIGVNAGYDFSGSKRLAIDVTSSSASAASTPLIYGEFDNDLVRINGNLQYTGSLSDVSDRRLKEHFLPISNAVSQLRKLNGYTYFMKADTRANRQREYGLIAQEVQEVFPEMVTTVDAEKGYLGVSYVQLIPVLIEALKEQQATYEQQGKVLEQQSASIQELQTLWAEVEAIKKRLQQASAEQNRSETSEK